MLNTNGYTENNGTTSASTILTFQIIDPFEYNQYVNLLTDLDFNPTSELFGITDVKLTGRSFATNGTLRVRANWLHNDQFSITGLSASNFKIFLNGSQETIDGAISYDVFDKEYTIYTNEPIVAGQNWVVTLYDTIYNIPCTKLGNKFYRGTTESFQVV
jgi:hypothetical protein